MKDYSEFNFDEETAVNNYQLDVEVAQHGQRFMEWVKLYARAEKEMKQAEYVYKEMMAKIDLIVRGKEPEAYGLKKFTDTAIANIVKKNSKVKMAMHKFLDAQENYRILEEMKNEMGYIRKAMIESAVNLQLQGYHSNPVINKTGRRQLKGKTQDRLKKSLKNKMED